MVASRPPQTVEMDGRVQGCYGVQSRYCTPYAEVSSMLGTCSCSGFARCSAVAAEDSLSRAESLPCADARPSRTQRNNTTTNMDRIAERSLRVGARLGSRSCCSCRHTRNQLRPSSARHGLRPASTRSSARPTTTPGLEQLQAMYKQRNRTTMYPTHFAQRSRPMPGAEH